MRIPKRKDYPKGFWVGDAWWDLKFCNKLGKDMLGECDFSENQIKILTGQTPKETLSTLCHELIHCFFIESGIEIDDQLEECICNAFEKQMVTFLLRNQ